MLKKIATTLFFVIFLPCVCLAHPHSFVEADVSVVFDDKGLAGFKQKWVIDEMTSFSILEAVRADFDGKLSAKEKKDIEALNKECMSSYNFFTDVRIDGKKFAVKWITDFSVAQDGAKLIYSFLVPCHVAAGKEPKKVKIAVYDDSFYTYCTLTSEGGKSVDPTKDPMFANKNAPANPGDFKRFAESVGIGGGGYSGQVKLEGPVQNFSIKTDVEEEPDMAYFYDQIVPEVFVVDFERK